MKADAIRNARTEAIKFLDSVDKVQITRIQFSDGRGEGFDQVVEHTKDSAACRRASMDLTRALTRMRKS